MSESGVPWRAAAVVTALIFATLFVVAVVEVVLGPNPVSANAELVVVLVIVAWGVHRISAAG